MKNLIVLGAFALFSLTGCKKDPSTGSMIVVKDCTGTYLRIEGKDYKVCNDERLARFSNGTTVKASYKMIRSCEAQNDRIICMMYHASEGWIEVMDVM